MKAFYSITIASLLAAVAANAADVPVKGGSVSVTRQQCQALTTYRPAAGVAYQPGVDVHGKPVAPADLPGSGAQGFNLPRVVEFNLQVNPINYAQRTQAAAATGQAAGALSSNTAAQQAAQAAQPLLAQKLGQLQTNQTTLAAQQAALNTQIQTANAAIVARTGGLGQTDPNQLAQRRSDINLSTNSIVNSQAYQANQTAIVANNAAIAQTNGQIATNNQSLAALPTQAQQLQTNLATAQGQAVAAGGGGVFDNTALPLGHVAVDTQTGAVTLDGRPMGNSQEQALADLCAKAGY